MNPVLGGKIPTLLVSEDSGAISLMVLVALFLNSNASGCELMRPEWCRVRVSVSQGLMHWHNEHNLFLARMAFLQVHHFRAVSGPSGSVCLTVTCFSRYVFFAALRVAAPSPSLCSPQCVKDFYCPNSINSKSNARFTTFSLFLNSFILPLSCLSPNGSS